MITFQQANAHDNFSFNVTLSQEFINDAAEAKIYTTNYCLLLDSVTEALIQQQILPEDTITELLSELKTHPIDDNTIILLARMTRVWCQKS
ncbi:MAG: hypothetical protein COB66_01935 [Coxiella sp. (in: Bacteria)]|nr:MAG: hypothetical protein COB66_01935 [Coxiella sp. (in: g-proteobacteria)]